MTSTFLLALRADPSGRQGDVVHRPHPIVACLEPLHAQWVSFAQRADARLLVWRATDEEVPFIDAFVARECESDFSETPDLFLQLSTPFAGDAEHGHRLLRELAESLVGAVPASALAPSASRAPRSSSLSHDCAALLSSLSSLRGVLTDLACPALLAVWLTPETVSSWPAYLLWLQRLVQHAPANVRFVVLEQASDPHYMPLVDSEPERVFAQSCELAIFAAIERLASDADTGSPAAAFRRLQAQLAARLAAGELARAVSTAAAALALADRHDWPELGAVVQMTLGAAYSAADKPLEASAAYAAAEHLGAQCETLRAEKPTGVRADERQARGLAETSACGTRIRLQACLGQAAVWLGKRAYAEAASAYERSAHLAHTLGDSCAELDAYRMASLCFSALADADRAWQRALHGLRVALAMDSETRRHSTLAYLAQHLLSLTERHRAYRAHRRPLEKQLARLL